MCDLCAFCFNVRQISSCYLKIELSLLMLCAMCVVFVCGFVCSLHQCPALTCDRLRFTKQPGNGLVSLHRSGRATPPMGIAFPGPRGACAGYTPQAAGGQRLPPRPPPLGPKVAFGVPWRRRLVEERLRANDLIKEKLFES